MKMEYPSYGGSRAVKKVMPVVTPQMVRARTVELAEIAGRNPLEIRQRDYERAKRELTGESDPVRQLAILYPLI